MQVLDLVSNDKAVSTWQDDTGSYIRGFLISTKQNKNNWKIRSTTQVNDFIGKDFAVIPHRIGNKALLDGHVVGTKEEVLNAYAQNSYGKIIKVLGPFNYQDGTNDVYYEHITKLTNNKVATALLQHGTGTLVPFATSPHIFALEGNDIEGWSNWEPAGIVLVSNPAFGSQSVITKSCNGEQTKCTKALQEENKIAAVVETISSFITSDSQNAISMDTVQEVSKDLDKAATDLTQNSTQVQETAKPEQNKIITDPITKQTESQESNTSEEVRILKQQIAEMHAEKKNEILQDMFAIYEDEKERDKYIKEIAEKNNLETIKYLKGWVDVLAPLYKKQGATELQKQIKMKEDAIKAESSKYTKNKVASLGKFQLPGEPSDPENPESDQGGEGGDQPKNKIASTKKIGEVAEFITLLKGFGGNS